MIKEQIIKDLGNVDFSVEMLATVPENFTGDYSLPCFMLAKKYGKNPAQIATEFVNNYKPKGIIKSITNMGPYINITLDKSVLVNYELQPLNFSDFKGKVACIDFSSINLAKHPHIGHLCTTIIGACIARLLEKVGYKVVRINYLGDYGTPFGKLITAIKLWGNREEIEKGGVDAIQDLYVKFNQEETEELIALARDWFRRVEEKDAEALEIYNWIIKISLNEIKQVYDKLGIEFDDYNGESYYEGKKDEVISLLKSKNLLFKSEGALFVDLKEYGLGDYMVLKSDGTSIYATRDIAAAIDRKQKYDFDISLYVTDTAQNLHFKSLFKTLELAGFDWAKDCKHIGYGRLSTPEGKIASRRGKVAVLKDIFENAENKAYEIVKERGLPKSVATDIGVSAVSFGLLKTERVKDCVFDLESALNFDGETSVYLQYTNARVKSVLAKCTDVDLTNSEYKQMTDDEYEIINHLDSYREMIFEAYKDFEPCYISRYAIKLATLFNKFYASSKIISDEKSSTAFRVRLCKMVGRVLEDCMKLLGVKIIEKM